MTAGLWYVVVFSLVIGLAIPAFWFTAVLGGGVPELAEGKREIWFHIAAEVLTGATLIAGGVATWASDGSSWTALVSCLGLGMLAYTVIVSPGYYADRKNWPMVGMFAAVWVGAVAAIVVRLTA